MFLEAHSQQCNTGLTLKERKLLLQAKERLLADSSCAPTIQQLSDDVGLNTFKLKQGFKQLFGCGVYGVFQKARMQEAYRRLALDEAAVTHIALDLGYSNTRHFAAAFRKQFGTNPSQIKKTK